MEFRMSVGFFYLTICHTNAKFQRNIAVVEWSGKYLGRHQIIVNSSLFVSLLDQNMSSQLNNPCIKEKLLVFDVDDVQVEVALIH